MGQAKRYSAINDAPLAVVEHDGLAHVLAPETAYELADGPNGGNESEPVIVYRVIASVSGPRRVQTAVKAAVSRGRTLRSDTGRTLVRGR